MYEFIKDNLIACLAVYPLFILILAVIVGKWLKRNMITLAPESTEKYFKQQEQDRTFPNHNMNNKNSNSQN